jgi:plastocyanin
MMRSRVHRVVLAAAAIFAPLAGGALAADEMPVYPLVAKDGRFEPATIEVAAGKRFKIEITNAGKTAIEFESKELKQEKVLAPGAKSSVVINGLKPGEYGFFDEYHEATAKGKIVAK